MSVDARGDAERPAPSDLLAELEELRAENALLRARLEVRGQTETQPDARPSEEVEATTSPALSEVSGEAVHVSQGSPSHEKVALFRSRFTGRDDVYARSWSNERTGKSGWSPAVVGGATNAKSPDREYLPFTGEVVEGHLAGKMHAGIYPLLHGDTCRMLASDFDGPGWALDACAYLDAARSLGIPGLLERSRSGEGGHVWIFFAEPVPASSARRLGVHLIREAMTVRVEIDLASYDRLFPTQDFMPKGSFGNLIALPLQGECRRRGTTVFLDPVAMEPFADQWEPLASIEPIPSAQLEGLMGDIGVVETGPDAHTFRRGTVGASPIPVPRIIDALAGAMLSIDRVGVPPALVAALKHASSIHNPEFYEKERMRFSTWNTPRFIRCYREELGELRLPRGLRETAARVVEEAGSELRVVDGFEDPQRVDVELLATLTSDQAAAVDALALHDLGMLVAPPGSGKTVVGCALIARHRVPTLVLVDRKPLVEQWRDRLVTHLDVDAKQIGQLGGGRSKTKGLIDVVMVQSLARREDIAQLTAQYGMVIVDECHHVPAVTFERAVREIPVRRWIGLTATPYRRDGLQAMMAMQCGPVRHTMSAPEGAERHSLRLVVHQTAHEATEDGLHIQSVFRGLVEDDARTATICDDIVSAAAEQRNCLVLTRWTEHLELIASALDARGVRPLVLHGQMGKKARTAVLGQLEHATGGDRGFVLAATASLLGEGFDCPPLNTLFLAFPIKFKGSVVQYVGRVLRPTPSKTIVEVHDYVDAEVPVLGRMHHERRKAYRSLGFEVPK